MTPGTQFIQSSVNDIFCSFSLLPVTEPRQADDGQPGPAVEGLDLHPRKEAEQLPNPPVVYVGRYMVPNINL